jgi:pimeloyl-ACP methyl ester carboxylesterase
MSRYSILAAALAALAMPAQAQAEYTVPWDATAIAAQQGQNPDGPPAGANDFDCEPTRKHPHPVVLVHGLAANQTVNWPTMSPFLANRGYCVFSLTYGRRESVDFGAYQPGGLLRMQRSARQLRRFVKRVRNATGARKVDIVGHSEGSLMPNYWVRFMGGARVVDDYVGVTPLWDGTNLAGLATIDEIGQALGLSQVAYDTLEPYCASCRQFLSSSKFMRKMNSRGGPAAPGVDYTMIMTKNDELVQPWQSGYMDGATNHVVQDQCGLDQSEHLSIIFDPTTAFDIWNALEPPSRQHEVPCVAVLPFVGAVGYSGN